MKFTINNNEFYLNDVKLDKLISYSIEADTNRTKLTIELIVDDVEIDSIVSERRWLKWYSIQRNKMKLMKSF